MQSAPLKTFRYFFTQSFQSRIFPLIHFRSVVFVNVERELEIIVNEPRTCAINLMEK